MDVITNALEGVRQYFQGLPTASSSTASPTYPQSTQATTQSSVPYWPPHQDSRSLHDVRGKDVIPQRPPSHSDTNSRPPSHQSVPHEANTKNQQQKYYNSGTGGTNAFVDNGQYLHGYHNRDGNGSQFQQSSHILPNPSYQQRTQNQQVQDNARQRQEEGVSYHQMQVPTSYYQNHRSYYKPATSNSSVYNNNNKTTTSQNQIQYAGSANSGINDVNSAGYNKFIQHNQQQQQLQNSANNHTTGVKDQQHQQVKTSHNLPPIAGLSNYAGYKPKTAIKNKVIANSMAISTSSSSLVNNAKLYSGSQTPARTNVEMGQHQTYRNVGQQYHTSGYVNSNSTYQQQYQSSGNLGVNQQQSVGAQNLNQQGLNQQTLNQQGLNQHGLNQQSLNQHGLNQQSLNQQNLNQQSLNQPSLNQQNVNQQHSLNQQSLNQQTLNQQSLNQQNLNQQNLNQQNLNQQGLNQQGLNQQNTPYQNTANNQQSNHQLSNHHQSNHNQSNHQHQPNHHQSNHHQANHQQSNHLQINHHQSNRHQSNHQQSYIHPIQTTSIKNEYPSTQISSPSGNNNSNNFDSVLDLSLKTIKTPADSTLDDNASSEERNQTKYLQMRMSNNQRYDQRGGNVARGNVTSAPKVDFTPNFNRPLTHSHATSYNSNNLHDRRNYPYQNHNDGLNHNNANTQNNRYGNMTQNYSGSIQNHQARKESLPRIDFPSSNQIQKSQGMYVHQADQRKRISTEGIPTVVQNKKPKVEEKWRQAIDKQIEQKFSLYQNKNASSDGKKTLVNGNLAYHSNNQYHHQGRQYHMNQTYVPSAVAHQYPQSHHQGIYQQHLSNIHRSNSQTSLNRLGHQNNAQGADKRVISILRSNLEMKGAKEAQRKLDQKVFNAQPSQREVQQPSTDVMAPLQPKIGNLGRQNVSPFMASSIVERSTPPISYKFPKAIDSVRFELEKLDDKPGSSMLSGHQSDLDGLAANLAARIRTKGELKQMQQTQTKSELTPGKIEDNLVGLTPSSGSPPKLTKEKLLHPPRRRLFNRPDDDQSENSTVNKIPPRDQTGLRSSSETSVFDFPDSDSDTEMPVLERQSLEDMRRDRKSISKASLFEEEKLDRSPSPLDDTFDKACDNFMEQLKSGGGKKRGRRKKIEADVLAKLQNFDKDKTKSTENILNSNNNNNNNDITEIEREESSTVIKIEKVEVDEEGDYASNAIKPSEQKTENLVKVETVKEIVAVATFRSEVEELKQETKAPEGKQEIKKEPSESSDSEDESQSPEARERKKRMQEQIKKSQQLFALRNLTSCLLKPPKKPIFGDGSDFYPGWEEELYKYKKSLRIPDNLIHVTRPPNCQRLSTSLPDLDPCPSPTTSSIIDEFKFKKKESYDSDIDSNCSFNFSLTKNYDSEEGSSVKSFNISKSRDSILDKLVERYSVKQKRRVKKKEELPKIIPKSENPLELLPTPSLDVGTLTEKKKSGTIIKTDSVFLGFRKKTVENFKDTFINTSNIVGVSEQFTPVVLKSRTRKETRVLKQKATIREVFGEDRPASAPPVTCVDELKDLKNVSDEKLDSTLSPKEVLKNKLLNKGKKLNLLKDLSNKEGEDGNKQADDAKSETPSLDGDETVLKKRSKFRNMRRKASSGFDYIRKKKKQVKKEEAESGVKVKRTVVKANPESVQDIQKEIKMWVLNKGIGETHLHRSARLGYTDITAYCLEKMDCSPSPKDNAGYTPLHEACSRGHLSTAKLLLMYGANVSESAQGGIRPLHEATENGFVEIVRLLLAYGADPMLATYAGITPLSLANEEQTRLLLENHIQEIQGKPSDKWFFNGPASCFDPEESGYDPLEDAPQSEPLSDDNDLEDMDFEVSDVLLPNLYTLENDPSNDRWILLQDLSNLLKIKSKDALLKQISPLGSVGNKNVLKELKMTDFLEQARCCQFLNAGEKINPRASKIALIKYTDKVKELLNVENITIPAR